MNDFTEEELRLLGGCVFSKFIASLNDPTLEHLQPELKKLRDKLELMFSNYCEHEWENKYSGSIIYGIYCHKCGKKLKGS